MAKRLSAEDREAYQDAANEKRGNLKNQATSAAKSMASSAAGDEGSSSSAPSGAKTVVADRPASGTEGGSAAQGSKRLGAVSAKKTAPGADAAAKKPPGGAGSATKKAGSGAKTVLKGSDEAATATSDDDSAAEKAASQISGAARKNMDKDPASKAADAPVKYAESKADKYGKKLGEEVGGKTAGKAAVAAASDATRVAGDAAKGAAQGAVAGGVGAVPGAIKGAAVGALKTKTFQKVIAVAIPLVLSAVAAGALLVVSALMMVVNVFAAQAAEIQSQVDGAIEAIFGGDPDDEEFADCLEGPPGDCTPGDGLADDDEDEGSNEMFNGFGVVMCGSEDDEGPAAEPCDDDHPMADELDDWYTAEEYEDEYDEQPSTESS